MIKANSLIDKELILKSFETTGLSTSTMLNNLEKMNKKLRDFSSFAEFYEKLCEKYQSTQVENPYEDNSEVYEEIKKLRRIYI